MPRSTPLATTRGPQCPAATSRGSRRVASIAEVIAVASCLQQGSSHLHGRRPHMARNTLGEPTIATASRDRQTSRDDDTVRAANHRKRRGLPRCRLVVGAPAPTVHPPPHCQFRPPSAPGLPPPPPPRAA